jgi:intein/homing endonuclease
MYTIRCNGKEVKLTEDHSLMILRDGDLIETRINEIQKGDKIVKISGGSQYEN